MNNLKAQLGAKEIFTSLIVIFSLAIVGFLTFANVTNTAKDIFPADNKAIDNESVTISVTNVNGDNSTLLSKAGFKQNSETVKNASNSVVLVRNSDYKITLTGTSEDLTTRANFTLLNSSNITGTRGYNNTELKIDYQYSAKSSGRLSAEKIDDTTLDAFELGAVGLIVMAAVAVLGFIYYLAK